VRARVTVCVWRGGRDVLAFKFLALEKSSARESHKKNEKRTETKTKKGTHQKMAAQRARKNTTVTDFRGAVCRVWKPIRSGFILHFFYTSPRQGIVVLKLNWRLC